MSSVFFSRWSWLVLVMVIAATLLPTWHHQPTAKAYQYTSLGQYRFKDFFVLKKDGLWHVFGIHECKPGAVGCDNTRYGFMHMTSRNLKDWTEVGFVVPPGGPGAWDADDVWAPHIIERNGTYYMFYTGVDINGAGANSVQKIGLATSTDLYTWTKSGSNPIFDCSTQSWAYWNPSDTDGIGTDCRDPNIYWDEGEHQWVMFVSGRWITNHFRMVIGIVTSEDLTTWREYNYISTTVADTSESAYVWKHNNTYYLSFTDSTVGIKYVTSSSIYSGWSTKATMNGPELGTFAAEYFTDRGREYMAYPNSNHHTLDFVELTYVNGSPDTHNVQEISWGSIGDTIWNDTDGDGLQDAGESGHDGATVSLYEDDGDGLFEPASGDPLYTTVTTGDDPNTGGTQHGFYKFRDLIPGSYWMSLDGTNFASGGSLDGYVGTTNNSIGLVVVSNNQNVTSRDIGFKSMDTVWQFNSPASLVNDSSLTIDDGRVSPTVVNDSPAWWNSAWRYRRQLTVTAGTEILTTSHTVDAAVDLSSLMSAGKVQSDYDDVRLVRWNGSADTELDLDIIDNNTERFKIQSTVSAGNTDTSYYLYYGNSTAVRRPTQETNVYEYYQSFNAPDASSYASWNEDVSAGWDIVANRYKQTSSSGGDRATRDNSKTITLTDDWAAEVTLNIVSGSGGIAGIALKDPDVHGADGYWFNYDAVLDNIRYWRAACGSSCPNGFNTATSTTINTGTDYTARVEYNYVSASAKLITTFLNDSQAAQKLETFSDYDIFYFDNQKTSKFGLNTFDAVATFNDYKGWQLHDGSVNAGTEVSYYPARTATLHPITSQAIPFSALQSFAVTSLSQGGTIQFVLSNDSGSTWQYWNGSAWTSSNISFAQSNTADTISAQAESFPSGSGQLLWQAVLSTGADQQPVLMSVGVNVAQSPSAPIVSSPATGAETSTQPTFTFSTTDPEGDAVTYQLQMDTTSTFNSASLTTITDSTSYASGVVASITTPSALGPGTYFWRVRAIDPSDSNRYGSYSVTRSFTVPTSVEETSIEVPTVTSIIDGQEIIDRRPVISGTGPAGSAIFIMVDRELVRTVLAGANGKYSVGLRENLSLGQHSLVVRAKVAVGQVSAESAPLTFSVVPPFIGVTIRDQVIVNGSSPKITLYVVAPAHSNVDILIDGHVTKTITAAVNANEAKGFVITILPTSSIRLGQHALTLVARNENDRPSRPSRVITFAKVAAPQSLRPINPAFHYSVKANDSLWSIADRFFGNGRLWTLIRTANIPFLPGLRTAPSILRPGWNLLLPPRST